MHETSSPGVNGIFSSQHEIYFILRWAAMLIVCVFGAAGSCFVVHVLHRRSVNSFHTHQLKILAIVDCMFLLMVALQWTVPAVLILSGRAGQLVSIKRCFNVFVRPLVSAAHLGSMWMAVILAANRYIIVCKPLEVVRYCSQRNTRLQLIALGMFVTLYNIPPMFNYYYVENKSWNVTPISDVIMNDEYFHPVYQLIYDGLANFVFVYFLPIGVIINYNVRMIIDIRRSGPQHFQMMVETANGERIRNITNSFVLIICFAVVCQTPAMINGFLNAAGQQSSCSVYGLFDYISKLLLSINSALNFVIYHVIRRRFRRDFGEVFPCGRQGQQGVDNVIQPGAIEHINA